MQSSQSTDGGHGDDAMLLSTPDRTKLASLFLGDGGFESMMKERSRLRKEKEEHSLAQVMMQLTAAERALAVETQRRIQSTHAIQKNCTIKIQEMEHNFERILNERSLRIEERLASVQERVDELTSRFEEEKERVPRDIEARGIELKTLLEDFQKELTDDRNNRYRSEGRLLKQMDDHSNEILGAIEKENIERERIQYELQTRMEENERQRSQYQHDLQSKIQNEMTELREMIEREEQERKLADDEIIIALDKYTQQLQNSLSVISS